MLSCWVPSANKRPTFEALHNDLIDIDAADHIYGKYNPQFQDKGDIRS